MRITHRARVVRDGQVGGEERGELGKESMATTFDDQVKIAAELSRPAYCFLLAFNADGTEQLLWPCKPDGQGDEQAVPPLLDRLAYPKTGHGFTLNDEPAGGSQAIALVASAEPLPSYAEWVKVRGPAAWKKHPPGLGVWNSDGEGVYPVVGGMVEGRGEARPLLGAPPLLELCQSLQRGAPGVVVESLAFPVRAKE